MKTSEKAPVHELALIVQSFKDFMGDKEFYAKFEKKKERAWPYWSKQFMKLKYGDALDIIKSLETLPLKYNKAGTIINKLKKFNGTGTTTISRQ